MTAQGANTAPAATRAGTAGARSGRSTFRKASNGLHEIADGAHRAEILRRHLAADDLADAVDQVDGVDAVDFEVFGESRRRRDSHGIDLEQLGKRRAQYFQNFRTLHRYANSSA